MAALSVPAVSLAQIEEIVVTVRKTEENLQDVPLSVATLDNEQIRRLGINDIRSVVRYTPGLQFDDGYSAQDTRIVIRGLSPTRGRPNVAFLVDGIDFTGEAVSTAGGAFSINQRLLDVERVEIVRGPQSALYGRSAFAGAIQYITKTPSLSEREAEVRTDIGSDSQYQVTAALGTPIGDTFGIRANLLWYDEDGFYDNALTGEDVGGKEGRGLSLTGLWQPADNLSIKVRGAYSDEEFDIAAQTRVPGNTLVDVNDSVAAQGGNTLIRRSGGPFNLFNPNYPDCPTASAVPDGTIALCYNTPKVLITGDIPDADELKVMQSQDPNTGFNYPGTDLKTTTLTMVANWYTDVGTFTSFSGLSHSESDELFDGDREVMKGGVQQTPLNPADAAWAFTLPDCGGLDCSPIAQQISFDNETDLLSQEIRFATERDGFWNVTVGGLYWNEDVDQDENSVSISPSYVRGDNGLIGLPPDQNPTATSILSDTTGPDKIIDPSFSGRETDHWSVYGALDLEFGAAWRLRLEGRYVDEELTVEGPECLAQESVDRAGFQLNVTSPIIIPPQNPGDDPVVLCGQGFRGASATVIANGQGTAPDGTYVNAVTRNLKAKNKTNFFVPKATLEWQATDDQLYYASVGEGRKPGGISTLVGGNFFEPQNNRFDDEKLTAYELGAKTVWANGNVIVNAAVYYQDYTDKQVGVTRFDPRIESDVGSIENAGESEIYGIELDAQWRINDHWFVSASYAYTEADYSKFDTVTNSSNEIARLIAAEQGGCLSVIPGPVSSPATCRVSFTDNAIEDVPEHAFVGYGRFSMPIGGRDMEFFVDANVNYTDERYMDETNVKELDDYWLVDTRAGLVTDAWEIVAFVDNVFDDDTIKSGVDLGSLVDTMRQAQWPPAPGDGVIVNMPKPRLYGIRAAFRYGAAKRRR